MGFGAGEGCRTRDIEPAGFGLEGRSGYAVWHPSWTREHFVLRISLISPRWFAGIRHPGSRVFAAFSEAAPAADAGRQFIP
jgi:hypothetical protein